MHKVAVGSFHDDRVNLELAHAKAVILRSCTQEIIDDTVWDYATTNRGVTLAELFTIS